MMAMRILAAFLAGCLSAGTIGAADIGGLVVIERKLTRRNVTASAPAYQRGVAVPLEAKAAEDPLAFERSHVVVYLDGAGNSSAPSSGPASRKITAEIQQQDRQFSPDMVVVPVGSTVSFPNLDAIFHNIFSLSKPRSFDLGNYPKGETRTVTFPVPGIVYVYCHLHPNMSATIVVSPTQWCVRANADGHFVLPAVPPGKYSVVAWHKAAGFVRKTVTVTENGAPPLIFDIPLTEGSQKSVAQR
jgi:plastocyanin